MTTFRDGPCNGIQIYGMDRLPLFLRMAGTPTEERLGGTGWLWRPLAGLSQTPMLGEELFAYQRVTEVEAQPAVYKYVAVQPDRLLMVSTNAWREWTQEQVEEKRIRPERA